MKSTVWQVLVTVIVFSGGLLKGATPAETNAVVRTLLQRALYYSSMGPVSELDCDVEDLPSTWNRFLWERQAGGWSIEAKEAAFDDYLARLGSIDCRTLDPMEQEEIRVALNCCKSFSRTNTVPLMKRIALNPRGVYRQIAIEAAVAFSPVNDDMTRFVETVVTNSIGYHRQERCLAWASYSQKVQTAATAGDAVPLACVQAAGMYYRNRFFDIAGAMSVDKVLLACLPEYGSSSNRIQMAVYAIDHEGVSRQTRNYYISVTNELLSSGQPLRQLNIGEDAE